MNTPDKCPHCGAIRVEGREYACGFVFREGVKHNPRTHECLLNSERTAHAATKRELEKLKDDLEWAVWNLAGCDVIAMGHSKPFDYAKEHARPALDSVSRMAQRLDAAEARVQELEGLVITGIHKFDGGVGVAITLPEHLTPTIGKTLGEAMPRKEEK